jgi:hypothetical protein
MSRVNKASKSNQNEIHSRLIKPTLLPVLKILDEEDFSQQGSKSYFDLYSNKLFSSFPSNAYEDVNELKNSWARFTKLLKETS